MEVVRGSTRGSLYRLDGKKMLRVYDASSQISARGGISAQLLRSMDVLTLRHPNLLRVTSVELHQSKLCLVMERADATLADADLKEAWPLVKRMIVDVLQALSFLHQQGFVHRRLQPSNILLFRRTAKLGDFQDLCVFYPGQPRTPLPFPADETPFVAPELLAGHPECSPATDMWSLGVILHWLLYDRTLPFVGLNETLTPLFDLLGTPSRRWRETYLTSADITEPPRVARPFDTPGTDDPDALLLWELMKRCLLIEPDDRISAPAALVVLGSKEVPGRCLRGPAIPSCLPGITEQTVRREMVLHVARDVELGVFTYHAALMGIILYDRVRPNLAHSPPWDLFAVCCRLGGKLTTAPTAEDCTTTPAGVQLQLEISVVNELDFLFFVRRVLSLPVVPLKNLAGRSSRVLFRQH